MCTKEICPYIKKIFAHSRTHGDVARLVHTQQTPVFTQDTSTCKRDVFLYKRDVLIHKRVVLIHKRDVLMHKKDMSTYQKDLYTLTNTWRCCWTCSYSTETCSHTRRFNIQKRPRAKRVRTKETLSRTHGC